jgi:hypothetical protein
LKAQRSSLTLIVLLLIALGLPNAVAATKPKAAGRSATAVINTVLNGKGAPSKSIGIDGDFYIDTRSLLISGPKTNGKWPAARSMQGANGTNGVNGTNGSDGRNGNDAKNISTASTVAGPAGPKGEPGTNGSDGANGSRGSDGSNGANGSNGSIGATGATGPAGSGATGAAGASGTNGTNGSNGANGTDGVAGATGAAGARGETGTAGLPEVADIVIPTWTLQTATAYGFATSIGFGELKAGKSYQISILLWGTTNSVDSPYGIELLTSSGVGPSYFYTVSPYRYAMTSTTSYKYGFSILGTLVVGDADVSLSVKVIGSAGDTTSKPMVITGKALITLVGQVK